MKTLVLNRFVSVILCVTLALGLSACGGEIQPPVENEKESLSQVAEASLTLLRDSMDYYNEETVGAVAYLGYREAGDATSLKDWIQKNCLGLAVNMPFILEIPEERILGSGYGQLYCIVPRNKEKQLTVSRITWENFQYDVNYVEKEVLYQEKTAEPVLVFVNFERGMPGLTDILIRFEIEPDLDRSWFPQVDESTCPEMSVYDDKNPRLLDFEIFGDVAIGLDAPKSWQPMGDAWILPPTEMGLADTGWSCEGWEMRLNWDNNNTGDKRWVDLYYQAETGQEYTLAYTGTWSMKENRLCMEISDGKGHVVNGSFPVFIGPSGEQLLIQRDRKTNACLPFFDEEVNVMELTMIYG